MRTWQMNWRRNTARKNNADGVIGINTAGKARPDVKRDKNQKRNIFVNVPFLVFMAARDKGQQKL